MKQIKQWLFASAIAVSTLAVTAPAAQAAVIQVDFKYTGARTLDMTGSFKYDDSLIGTDNLVQKDDLLAFSYDVFVKGSTVSSFHTDLATIKAPGGFFSTFNFNYDAANTRFVTGNAKNVWLSANSSFGFEMQKSSSLLGLGPRVASDTVLYASPSPFSYTVSAVPEPETYGLMLLGLSLVGAVARRRKQA